MVFPFCKCRSKIALSVRVRNFINLHKMPSTLSYTVTILWVWAQNLVFCGARAYVCLSFVSFARLVSREVVTRSVDTMTCVYDGRTNPGRTKCGQVNERPGTVKTDLI